MNLNILIVQPDPIWENTEKNLSRVEDILLKHGGPADLILLPELFQLVFQ
mgnify:CR=1 FL=1